MTETALYARNRCSTLVVTCSDFRFKSAERALAEATGIVDDYDLIARPGSTRSLVQPRSAAARQSMEEELQLLWAAHRFERVAAVHHTSCRAYDDLATAENEVAVHAAHLRAACEWFASRFHEVTADGYLIQLVDGEFLAMLLDEVSPRDAGAADEPPLHVIRGRGVA